MNDVVYTVAIGERHRRMAGMLALSLRRHGFNGDISCICDAPVEGCRNHIVPDDSSRIIHLRTEAEQLIQDIFDHDYILYLDADVLATGPLDAILGNDAVRWTVCAQQYNRILARCQHNFTQFDRKQPGAKWGVCAGIVGFPGNDLGRHFYRLWRYETSGGHGTNETALNVVLHRFPAISGQKWAYMPGVRMSHQCDDGECLVHYFQNFHGHPASKTASVPAVA